MPTNEPSAARRRRFPAGPATALAVLLSPALAPAAAAVDAGAVRPVQGLVVTNAEHSNTITAQSSGIHAYNDLDHESWTVVQSSTPEGITYAIQLSAPTNQQADADLRKFKLIRKVRHEDLEQSTRMTLLIGSDDPETYAGQTFAETSAKTLNLLKSGTAVPFVLGVRDFSGGQLDSLAGMAKNLGDKGPLSAGTMTSVFMMLGSGRDYYRGTLHRVEAGPVAVSVLLNGERVNLPAIHAAGDFTVLRSHRSRGSSGGWITRRIR